jgi:hypothetical protein
MRGRGWSMMLGSGWGRSEGCVLVLAEKGVRD